MPKRHAEPWKRAERCSRCGSPPEQAARDRAMEQLGQYDYTWNFCAACGEATCPELRELYAREVERQQRGDD